MMIKPLAYILNSCFISFILKVLDVLWLLHVLHALQQFFITGY